MSRRAVLFRSRCTSRSCLFDPLFDAVDAACLWWGVRLGPDPSGRSCRLLTGAPCWRHGQHPYAKDARAEITRVRRSLGAWDSFSVGAGWGVQGWSARRSGASVRRCAHSRGLRASVRCACRRLGAASARFWPPLRSSWSLSQRARAASSTSGVVVGASRFGAAGVACFWWLAEAPCRWLSRHPVPRVRAVGQRRSERLPRPLRARGGVASWTPGNSFSIGA